MPRTITVNFTDSSQHADGLAVTGRGNSQEMRDSYWDENPHLRRAIARQSNSSLAGVVLIAIGTALQIIFILLGLIYAGLT
ncbi:hypothetical protein [Novosphingobium sp. AAP93]|uniref:hypothetical protein n=1 Tax=Novosphingobium sp. AAP93 TaxID=1523427 RepID=UPI0006B9AAA8|nr:hypothetical protein [Novosphingobium sp. AAP93]KPF81421.1 hypothetical protein IP83_13335 [Novosphingobium sp. AAP93]